VNYKSRMQAWKRFGGPATDKLFDDYSELALSLPDEETIARALVAKAEVSAEEPNSVDSAYGLLERFFAELVISGALKLSEFGLSTLGNEQLAHLKTLVPAAA
jgi:hypothetical protein